MIDLGLNQCKIKEIKYEVKEGKTVIFKMDNYFNLEDVEIVEEKKGFNSPCTCHTKVVYDGAVRDETYVSDSEKVTGVNDSATNEAKNKFNAFPFDKSKKLIEKIKDVPYKVMGKVGTLYTFDDGRGEYEKEEDPYVVNDERETKKQKKILNAEEDEEIKARFNELATNNSKCRTTEELREELEKAYDEQKEQEFKNVFSLKDLDKYGPKKQLNDYEPFSCLKGEKGMQETLESSKKKEWIEDVRKHPSKPTPTGNALFPIDNTEIGKAMSENAEESLGTKKFYTISKEAAEAVGFKKVGTMKVDKTTDKIIEFTPNSNKDEDKQEE